MYKNGNNCILYIFISRSTISNLKKKIHHTQNELKNYWRTNIRHYLFNFYIFIKFTISQFIPTTVGMKIFIYLKLTTYFLTLFYIISFIKEQTLRKISLRRLETIVKNWVRKKKEERERRKKEQQIVKLSRFNHDKLKQRLNHSSRRLTNWMFGLICPR